MLPVISRDNIICYFKGMTGHNIDFCGDLPSRASEIQLSALENAMFYKYVSFKTKKNMMLACGSIFSRTSLDARPQNFQTFSKVKLKYEWGKQDTVFSRPSAIIYIFYLPGATGQAQMSSPVSAIKNESLLRTICKRKPIIY